MKKNLKNNQKQHQKDVRSVKDSLHQIQDMIEHLNQCKPLGEKQLRILCHKAKQVLSKEENVVSVHTPVIICGDIHGQFPDLMELLEIGGKISENRYMFLGDYVDRGHYSVETISLLLAYKVKYPQQITLLRGNHESRLTTKDYGFYDEIRHKYGNHEPWKMFMEVFDHLPLCGLIQNKFFCMHGGLSPKFETIDQIRRINRHHEIPLEGGMNDLLWSDPSDAQGFSFNSGRGVACYFGPDITDKFTHENEIKCIVRAHEVAMNGYELIHGKRVTTIFSAPNYCYRCQNKGCMMQLDEHMHGHFYVYGQRQQFSNEDKQNKRQIPKYFH